MLITDHITDIKSPCDQGIEHVPSKLKLSIPNAINMPHKVSNAVAENNSTPIDTFGTNGFEANATPMCPKYMVNPPFFIYFS